MVKLLASISCLEPSVSKLSALVSVDVEARLTDLDECMAMPISLGPCCSAPVRGSKCFWVASFNVLLISFGLAGCCGWRMEEMCPGTGSRETDEDGDAEFVSSFSSCRRENQSILNSEP